MNQDLLKKLVLLANHNNSEGEANSAARRVCKMIEEDNFKSLSSSHYVNEPKKWEDVVRSTEPFNWRNYNPYTDFNEIFDNIKKNYREQGVERVCIKCRLIVRTFNKDIEFICGICRNNERNK